MLKLLKVFYYDFLSLFVVRRVRYKVTGACRKCGKCCRDIRMKDAYDEKDFKLTQFFFPKYRRFEIIGKDENGDLILSCKLLNEDGTCSDYATRLNLCRRFPNKILYFQGVLQDGCGFKVEPEKKFEDYLKKKWFWQ